MRAYLRFVWLCARSAFIEAWKARGWAVGFAGLVGAIYWLQSGVDLNLAWVPLAALLLFFVGNLLYSPYRLYSDKEKECERLRRESKNQSLADVLSGFFEYGVAEIQNQPSDTLDGIPKWREEYEKWLSEVLEAMRQYGCTQHEIISVRTLGSFDERLDHPIAAVATLRSEISARLNRIRRVADKYAS